MYMNPCAQLSEEKFNFQQHNYVYQTYMQKTLTGKHLFAL